MIQRKKLVALSLVAVAAVIGGTLIGVGGPAAAAAAGTAPDPLSSCVQPKNVTNSDGSITQTWTTTDGHTLSETVPWPNFNPSTATNQQLERFNIPDRPTTSSSALASWSNEWTTAKFATISSVCTPGETNSLQWTNPIWTGYVSGNAGATYHDTNGDSNVSHGLNARCPNQSSISSWLGLEGGGTLTQAGWGTLVNVTQAYYWYEQYPAEVGQYYSLNGYPIHEGDEIYIHVHWNADGPSYHLADVTQGNVGYSLQEPWLQTFGGTRIDAISERTSNANGVPFDYRPYTGASAIYNVVGNGAYLNTLTPRGGYMTSSDGSRYIGEVGGIYSTGDFNTYWYGCS